MLRAATEQSPASVIIYNDTGKIIYTNMKFTVITGYETDEMIGKDAGLIAGSDYSAQLLNEAISDAVISLKLSDDNLWEWHGELENRKKSGEIILGKYFLICSSR